MEINCHLRGLKLLQIYKKTDRALPRQITSAQEIAQIKQMLSSDELREKSKDARTQGVAGAWGHFIGFNIYGGSVFSLTPTEVTFSATVNGVDASDMVVAGLRAFVEFRDLYGNTISMWEYSAAYQNNSGFHEMDAFEKMNGSCTRTATPLPIPMNARVVAAALYVWDRTAPGHHYQFLDYTTMSW